MHHHDIDDAARPAAAVLEHADRPEQFATADRVLAINPRPGQPARTIAVLDDGSWRIYRRHDTRHRGPIFRERHPDPATSAIDRLLTALGRRARRAG